MKRPATSLTAAGIPAWLAMAALVVQGILPHGFMVERDTDGGLPTVVMCHGQGQMPVAPRPVDILLDAGRVPEHEPVPEQAHEGDAGADARCVFALAFDGAPLAAVYDLRFGTAPENLSAVPVLAVLRLLRPASIRARDSPYSA
jgi:hypothetical protein